MRMIGESFVATREHDRIKAYKELQSALMIYSGILAPFAMAYKDIIGTTLDIEEYLKGSESKSGKSPIEEVREFLNRPPEEIVQ